MLLRLFHCRACDTRYAYPRVDCPNCHSTDVESSAALGTGTLYSFSVVHRAPSEALRKDVPYTVAIVRTDEGPHLMARLAGVDIASIAIGMRVQAVPVPPPWREQGIEHVFEPVAGAA